MSEQQVSISICQKYAALRKNIKKARNRLRGQVRRTVYSDPAAAEGVGGTVCRLIGSTDNMTYYVPALYYTHFKLFIIYP